MFHQLLESGPRARRPSSWTIVSGGAHAALVAAAVVLTMPNASRTIERVRLPDLVYHVPVRPAPPQPSTASSPIAGISRHRAPPLDLRINAPTVPGVNIRFGPSFEPLPREAFGAGMGLPSSDLVPRDQVHSVRHVDREVVPLRDNPRPAYPQSLRAAHAEGNVLVQFVVDTTGRVEQQSISIVRATHPGFADAVRRWLPQTRYAPAEARGNRVRQLVQQVVGFTLQ